jgi:hypothetical protein
MLMLRMNAFCCNILLRSGETAERLMVRHMNALGERHEGILVPQMIILVRHMNVFWSDT